MPSIESERYDFCLSRRGSVASITREVADAPTENGYTVLVQDYDIPLGASLVEAMHEQSSIPETYEFAASVYKNALVHNGRP
jgi:hypothetical protein